MTDADCRTVRVVRGGPVMVPGPVRIEMPDGTVVDSDRFYGGHLCMPAQQGLSVV